MTAKETLEKYGLKTDVKSIMERLFGKTFSYADFVIANGFYNAFDELYDADLALLCEHAEKGEKLDKQNDELQCELSMLRYDKVQLKQIREIVHEYICKNGDSELSMALNEVLNVFYTLQKGEPR